MTHSTADTTTHALDAIRSRAALLSKDSLDIAVWAKQTNDAELIDAALQFARARRTLYAVSNALLVNRDETAETDAGKGTG